MALLQESNEHLADRNDQVTNSFQKVVNTLPPCFLWNLLCPQVREEKERLKGDVEELSKLSNKLQGDIQQVGLLVLHALPNMPFLIAEPVSIGD